MKDVSLEDLVILLGKIKKMPDNYHAFVNNNLTIGEEDYMEKRLIRLNNLKRFDRID